MKKPKTPILTVDGIIKYYEKNKFKGIILIERKFMPKGFAIPGGMVEYGETVEHALKREMLEETGLKITKPILLGVYSNPKRDKRFHTASIVYLCKAIGKIKAGDDAKKAHITSLNKIPKLCFDHNKIIKENLKKIKKY